MHYSLLSVLSAFEKSYEYNFRGFIHVDMGKSILVFYSPDIAQDDTCPIIIAPRGFIFKSLLGDVVLTEYRKEENSYIVSHVFNLKEGSSAIIPDNCYYSIDPKDYNDLLLYELKDSSFPEYTVRSVASTIEIIFPHELDIFRPSVPSSIWQVKTLCFGCPKYSCIVRPAFKLKS
jgi:hypothetical protein